MLEVRSISKSFGTVRANRGVSLAVAPGEIVGLVGENGAGKSTLLSILAGFLPPDAGEIVVDGVVARIGSPRDALAMGIGLVHQHLSLVPAFTVREQLRLAGWTQRRLPATLDGFTGDERIEDLPPGRRQRVEIARAMARRPRVLLLDEPTSILAPSEVASLFAVLRELSREGTGIVVVTHKLREAMALADRIVVMARGEVTGAFERRDSRWSDNAPRDILAAMFDWTGDNHPHAIPSGDARHAPAVAGVAPILTARGLATAADEHGARVDGVSFDLHSGHIHAVAGIDGQGQTALAEALAGYRQVAGEIALDGRSIGALDAEQRARQGVGLLVDDRLGEAAVGAMSVAENLVLKRPRPASVAQGGLMLPRAMERHATALIASWDIVPAAPDAPFAALSGGNMQRVLAARELERQPRVLIALNPVQGLDVRTANLLWRRLREACANGGSVLVLTTDLDEAFAHGDTVAVMTGGRVSPFQPVGVADRGTHAEMMVNGW